jgi:hypothetical protein
MKHLAVIVGALLLSACNASADTDAAEKGVSSFHRAMDSGQYAAIYDASDSDMKSSISKGEFVKFLTGLHGKLGAFKNGKTTGWNDNVATGGHYVTLTREAKFDRGPGNEQFLFRIDNGTAVLAGYRVNSNVLVTS